MSRIRQSIIDYVLTDIDLQSDSISTEIEPMDAPSENFIMANVQDFKNSEQYKYMLIAQQYANVDNKVIEDRERYYVDEDGNEVRSKYLANNKIAHAKFARLVSQKVGYLVGKPFTIKSDDPEIVKFLESQFNQRGHRKVKRWVNEAMVNSREYMHAYFDERGIMSWKRYPASQIVPFWKDEDQSELDAVIRFYKAVRLLQDGSNEEYEKFEYHSLQGSWYFISDNQGLRPDPEYADLDNKKKALQQGHFKVHNQRLDEDGMLMVDENGDGIIDEHDAVWPVLPIIPLSYQYGRSLLKYVKPILDNYDKSTSDVANLLEEVSQAIKVIKGYDGSDTGEVVKNMNTTRVVFVSGEDGSGVENLDTTINTDAVEAHLTRLDDDFYVDGGGVNLKNDELGNASGAAIKYRYSGLETDMQDFASELAMALKSLSWFLLLGQVITGKLDEKVLHEPIDFIFNTDTVTNEKETVEMLAASQGMISQETITANHPLVENVDEELIKLAAEVEKNKLETLSLINEYGFNEEPAQAEDELEE